MRGLPIMAGYKKAINNERLAAFGLVSMSNYYAEKRVIC